MGVTEPEDRDAWLRLLGVEGLGREGARRLLASLGSPQRVFDTPAATLQDLAGPTMAATLLAAESDTSIARRQAVVQWLAAGDDRQLLTLADPAYPRALLESPDPPLLLYVQGRVEALQHPSIAVVGSRRATAQGRDHAHRFSRAFAQAGCVVVSGLALGIDGAAHEGALDGGGLTVAVVGTGLDRVYPKRHHALAHRIATQGALVSEFAPGMPPLAENFPQRNRIIAGLSLGTVVVEAALQSGSLITARLANEAGREVFAIPGSILSEQSHGCHALIRDGARLVESPDEVLDECRQPGLAFDRPTAVSDRDASDEPVTRDPLLEALGLDPMTLDGLQARTGWPTGDLLARLLELELDGRVARLAGGLYQRRAMA